MLLAAACELRYAAPDTTFYIPELDMGVPFSLGGVPDEAPVISTVPPSSGGRIVTMRSFSPS